MNRRPDRQDQERFRKLSQVKTSAYFFAAEAETAFRERLGHLPAVVPPEPPVAANAPEAAFAGMSSVFTLTGDLLAEREKIFDQAVLERVVAWIARRRAGRRRKSAFEALRKVVCAVRQFIQSVTDGQAHVHLGVRGPTPRDPEKLAAWGVLFRDLLPTADLPPDPSGD